MRAAAAAESFVILQALTRLRPTLTTRHATPRRATPGGGGILEFLVQLDDTRYFLK